MNDARLQYKIELLLAGMQDGPPGDLPFSERLCMLRSHQKAWKTLSWTANESVTLMGGVWELVGGVLGLASDGNATIVFRQIPSQLRGIPGREWTFESPKSFRDFTMDPSQDLLVTLQLSG